MDLQVQVQALACQAFPYQALHCLHRQEQTYNGLSQGRTAGDGDPVIVWNLFRGETAVIIMYSQVPHAAETGLRAPAL